MPRTTKTQIIRDSIRRFQHLPKRTIARHIINTYPDLFREKDGQIYSIDRMRDLVRYHMGKNGEKNRDHVGDQAIITDNQKIQMPRTWIRKVKPHYLPPGLWLILADAHVPFHEPLPLEQAIKYGQAQKVDGVFILGDLQDCSSLTYWPNARRDFNKEVEEVIDAIDFIRQEFPKQKIVYKPGNHEYRLPRRFVEKLPELADAPLAAIETSLGFEERNIEFLDYFQKVYAGKLPMIHGHEVQHINRMVNPARGLFLRAKSWAACAHCHTTSEHTSTTIEGDYLTCWSFGCLCNLHPEYNPFGNDWNWGFGLVNIEKDGDFEVENRRILPSGDIR